MNGQDLLLGMSFLDETLVQEAETEKRRTPAWKRWGAVAACAAILLAAAVALPIWNHGSMFSEIPQEIEQVDLGAVFVNEIGSLPDAARRYYPEEAYDTIDWDAAEVRAYYGRDLTPAYLPGGLTASPQNGGATIIAAKNGGIVEDTVWLRFYHDYHADGSPKLTDDVAAVKGFSLTASRVGLLKDCCYVLPEDALQTTEIGGAAVTFGYRSMPFGPYDPQTHEPSGYYDLYAAEFQVDGIEYEIVAEQMELKEVVKVVTSIICGTDDVMIVGR